MKVLVIQNLLNALITRKLHWEKMTLTFFLVFLLTMFAQGQNIVVKGRITNEKNLPLGDVSVVVKGWTTGTATNANGEFEIKAPAYGTLSISSVGFSSIEVDI